MLTNSNRGKVISINSYRLLLTTYCLLLVVGCGYAPVQYQNNISTVAVPVFENNTLRRGHEIELTHLVQNAVAGRTPYRLVSNPDTANLVILGEIKDYTTPALVEGKNDQVIESAVAITLKVKIKNQADNKIYEYEKTESGSLITRQGENEETAARACYEKLARWVVSLLEKH